MMANVNSYPTVSDGLAAIIRALEPNRKTGIVMVKADVAVFLEGLQALHDAARIIETMADKAQWNEAARRSGARIDRATLEAVVADGSVAILPVVPRATAGSRVAPEGGAA
jgi:hypothetical protein